MKLVKSAWLRSTEGESEPPNYCQFFPDEGIVLNITFDKLSTPPFHVWGCHYIDRGDGQVLTSLGPESTWKAESYIATETRLLWTTSSGKILIYDSIAEADLPIETERFRQLRFSRLVADNITPPPNMTADSTAYSRESP